MIQFPPFLDQLHTIIPALATWLLTYLVHSSILLAIVCGASRLLTAHQQQLRDMLWKIALVGGIITASVQIFGNIDPAGGSYSLSSQDDALAKLRSRLPKNEHIDKLAQQCTSEIGAESPKMLMLSAEVEKTFTVEVNAEAVETAFSDALQDSLKKQLNIRWAAKTDSGAFGNSDIDSVMASFGNLSLPLSQRVFEIDASKNNIQEMTLYEFGWMHWLILAWLFGAGFFAMRFYFSRKAMRELLDDRRAIIDGEARKLLTEICRNAGFRRHIRLSASPFLDSPIAISQNEICLPERALVELSAEQQCTMLAHETGHLLRLDPLWLNICAVLDILFFFQPGNRLARRELQDAAEYLCDDWAIRSTGQSVQLAKCLTAVAGWIHAKPQFAYVAGMAAGKSALARRVQRILQHNQRDGNSGKFVAALAAVMLLSAISWAAPKISSEIFKAQVFIVQSNELPDKNVEIQSVIVQDDVFTTRKGNSLQMNVTRQLKTIE